MTRLVAQPSGHADSVFVVSVSGGKDSTATILALREAEIPARYVFADTGWEVPQVYEHLALLEPKLGIKIDRVGLRGGMVGQIAAGRFPSRAQRWCTKELKIKPLRDYHDSIDGETISVVGVRAEESEARRCLPEFEFDDQWGGVRVATADPVERAGRAGDSPSSRHPGQSALPTGVQPCRMHAVRLFLEGGYSSHG